MYLPRIREFPLNKGMTWVPSWKSLPNNEKFLSKPAPNNPFTSLKWELASFALDFHFLHSREGIFSPGGLFSKAIVHPLDNKSTTEQYHKDMDFYEKNPGIIFADIARGLALDHVNVYPGRLSQTVEGAGKRRVFAIGNYVKQRLQNPVHQWAMAVLRSIPMDGTFHQIRGNLSHCYRNMSQIFCI